MAEVLGCLGEVGRIGVVGGVSEASMSIEKKKTPEQCRAEVVKRTTAMLERQAEGGP